MEIPPTQTVAAEASEPAQSVLPTSADTAGLRRVERSSPYETPCKKPQADVDMSTGASTGIKVLHGPENSRMAMHGPEMIDPPRVKTAKIPKQSDDKMAMPSSTSVAAACTGLHLCQSPVARQLLHDTIVFISPKDIKSLSLIHI